MRQAGERREREREMSLGFWLRMTKDHFKEVEKEENRPKKKNSRITHPTSTLPSFPPPFRLCHQSFQLVQTGHHLPLAANVLKLRRRARLHALHDLRVHRREDARRLRRRRRETRPELGQRHGRQRFGQRGREEREELGRARTGREGHGGQGRRGRRVARRCRHFCFLLFPLARPGGKGMVWGSVGG